MLAYEAGEGPFQGSFNETEVAILMQGGIFFGFAGNKKIATAAVVAPIAIPFCLKYEFLFLQQQYTARQELRFFLRFGDGLNFFL